MLDDALTYAAGGWHVLPLSPGKKTPLSANGLKDATTDPDIIDGWWERNPTANIGIRTGAESGIIVLDVDTKNGSDGEASLESFGPIPPTYEVATPNAGRHLYFVAPGMSLGNRAGLRPGLDVRGDGGYVVAPPSRLDGVPKPYTTVNIATLAPCPSWIHSLPPEQPPTQPVKTHTTMPAQPSRYAQIALRLECRAVRESTKGKRNHTLNTAAFNLGTLCGAGVLDRATAEAELSNAAMAVALPEGEILRTITSGMTAGILRPRAVPEPQRFPDLPPEVETTEPPGSILTPGPHTTDAGEYIEQSSAAFAGAVVESLPEDTLYRKAHIPGELLGEHGARRWVEASTNRVRLIVDSHTRLAAWHKRKDDGAAEIYRACDRDHAGLVIAAAQQHPSVRDLNLLIHYPAYGPGFERLCPGWHAGVYYDEPPDLQDIEPERDIEKIQEALYLLLIDFPFKDEASRQNFTGLLLTPIIAPAIEGNRPMHLLLSPIERTGKTKLAEEVLGGIILGRQTAAMQITGTDEERDKRLLALLLQGETIVHLDNLPTTIKSGPLASILTATTYQGRVLGSTRIISLPNTLVVVGSGNNTECSGEIAKRTVPILLQPRMARPEARTQFCHPDLRGYIRDNRRGILSVLLGMVENWKASGMRPHTNRLGGFEEWSEAIGGILKANAYNRWRDNEVTWRDRADPEAQDWDRLIAVWHSTYGERPLAATRILELADSEDCLQGMLTQRTERGRQTAFGVLLRRKSGAPVGQWRINQTKAGNRTQYKLSSIWVSDRA